MSRGALGSASGPALAASPEGGGASVPASGSAGVSVGGAGVGAGSGSGGDAGAGPCAGGADEPHPESAVTNEKIPHANGAKRGRRSIRAKVSRLIGGCVSRRQRA